LGVENVEKSFCELLISSNANCLEEFVELAAVYEAIFGADFFEGFGGGVAEVVDLLALVFDKPLNCLPLNLILRLLRHPIVLIRFKLLNLLLHVQHDRHGSLSNRFGLLIYPTFFCVSQLEVFPLI
jgi:hypothetical protein